MHLLPRTCSRQPAGRQQLVSSTCSTPATVSTECDSDVTLSLGSIFGRRNDVGPALDSLDTESLGTPNMENKMSADLDFWRSSFSEQR
jgi:hypothetical protein